MLELAFQNGISQKLYRSRVKRGWDENKAATTTPIQHYKGEFAVYKGDEIIAMGTATECAEELGVTEQYIRFMTTPTGKQRLENRKNPDNATTAVKLDVD